MTKSLLEIAKECGAKLGETWCKGYIAFTEDQFKATIDAYNAQADLISRDDAIQAIINVGGKRVWEFADAVKSLA